MAFHGVKIQGNLLLQLTQEITGNYNFSVDIMFISITMESLEGNIHEWVVFFLILPQFL